MEYKSEDEMKYTKEQEKQRNWLRLLKIQIAALILNTISIIISISCLLAKLL